MILVPFIVAPLFSNRSLFVHDQRIGDRTRLESIIRIDRWPLKSSTKRDQVLDITKKMDNIERDKNQSITPNHTKILKFTTIMTCENQKTQHILDKLSLLKLKHQI